MVACGNHEAQLYASPPADVARVLVLFDTAERVVRTLAELVTAGLHIVTLDVSQPFVLRPDFPPDITVVLNLTSPSAPARGVSCAFEAADSVILFAERTGVHVINGSRAMSLDRNKFIQCVEMRRAGVCVPGHILTSVPCDVTSARRRSSSAYSGAKSSVRRLNSAGSVFSKPVVGGSGVGVREHRTGTVTALPSCCVSLHQYSVAVAVPGTRKRQFYRAEFVNMSVVYVLHVETPSKNANVCPCKPGPGVKLRLCDLAEAPFNCDGWRQFVDALREMMTHNDVSIASVEFCVNFESGASDKPVFLPFDFNCNTTYADSIETECAALSITPANTRLAEMVLHWIAAAKHSLPAAVHGAPIGSKAD